MNNSGIHIVFDKLLLLFFDDELPVQDLIFEVFNVLVKD